MSRRRRPKATANPPPRRRRVLGSGTLEIGPSEIVRLNPPAIVPESTGAKSLTKSDHTPFGLEPPKTENDLAPEVVGFTPAMRGAGAGKTSLPKYDIGWKVPDATGPVLGHRAPPSANVRLALTIPVEVPPSKTTCPIPVGPTSRTPISCRNKMREVNQRHGQGHDGTHSCHRDGTGVRSSVSKTRNRDRRGVRERDG